MGQKAEHCANQEKFRQRKKIPDQKNSNKEMQSQDILMKLLNYCHLLPDTATRFEPNG
jgi:hypothetical protein